MGPGSPLYGMTQQQLQTALINAQNAYIALQTGTRTVSLSYGQGDGSKSVTYDAVQGGIAQLRLFIWELKKALGIVCGRPRRYVTFGAGWR